jgi:hypothetical protein
LTDLPGIDGGGKVWLFAAFTHGRVTFPCFAISIFDFRFLRMVLAKACYRDGIKIFIRRGFIEGNPLL